MKIEIKKSNENRPNDYTLLIDGKECKTFDCWETAYCHLCTASATLRAAGYKWVAGYSSPCRSCGMWMEQQKDTAQ